MKSKYPWHDDRPEQRMRKKLLFLGSCGGILCFLASLPAAINEVDRLWVVGSAFSTVVSCCTLLDLVARGGYISDVQMTLICSLQAAAVAAIDIHAGANLGFAFMWPFFLLLLDSLLLSRVRWALVVSFATGCLGWTVLVYIERVVRFGLFDLPGTPPQWERKGWTTCTRLPCPREMQDVAAPLISGIIVISFDCYFTERYTSEAVREKRRVETSVIVSQQLAASLAAFDLASAGQILEGADDLPPGLVAGFSQLIENLQTYKAYLPQACIPEYAMPASDSDSVKNVAVSKYELPLVESPLNSNTSTPQNLVPISDSPSSPSLLTRKSTRDLRLSRVTLLVLNVRGSLALSEADTVGYERLHGSYVAAADAASHSHKGIVDHFLGDHVYISFNAARPCNTHAVAAVRAYLDFRNRLKTGGQEGLETDAGIASGAAQCGNLGSETVRRHTVLGRVPLLAVAFQLAASRMGAAVLADAAVQAEAATTFQLRMQLRLVMVHKATAQSSPVPAFEVLTDSSQALPGTGPDQEWMYVVGNTKTWEKYNRAVMRYLRGGSAAEVRADLEGETYFEGERNVASELLSRLDAASPPEPPIVITM